MEKKLSEHQKRVAEFVAEHALDAALEYRVLDLVSETGELAKEILQSTGYGNERFVPTARWREEIGDVFFALICVANLTDSDLQLALETSLRKYARRIASTGSADSGP